MLSSGLKVYGLIFCLGAGFAACVPNGLALVSGNPPQKKVPHTPIDAKAAELGETTWNPEWNSIVERALSPTMLSTQVPRDVRRFCPRFYVMSDPEKRAFWAYFFQALAGAEAGLDPDATVRHTEPKLAKEEDVPVTKVRTEGLLQLTYADQRRYGCPFDEQADRGLAPDDPSRTILQPKNNLVCGVMILKNQIIYLHRPLLWSTSYWATLRPGTAGYRNFAKQMTNPPAACGLHSPGERHRATTKEVETSSTP